MTGFHKSVLLLGSGEFSEELVSAFHRLGVEVHTADSAVAKDPEGLRAVVDTHRPDFILPMIEDIATETLAELEESGTCAVIPSAKGCELTFERNTLRQIASQELGLPTTAYRFAKTRESFEQAVGELEFPCIVKPATYSAGRGHTVVRTSEDVSIAWANAHGDSDGAMVERFVDFDFEITLLAVRSIDQNTGKLATWFCEPIGHLNRDGRLVESWQPIAMSSAAHDNARSMAARISNALGGRGVFAVEMFVSGDDVYFSGVTPRPHDVGTVTLSSQRFSQYDLHARAVLGLPIDTTLVSPGACTMIYDPVTDLAGALSIAEADVRLYPQERGMVLVTSETVESARDRATQSAKAAVSRMPGVSRRIG